ncbi:MAG: 3-oxoacyl-ACP reductase FabG [Candidatus Thermoplasmatota archaeon]|nr:3-oxoacyl-ACP reductase FabG [Candidatus Thermoplasmatota archaeon]MBU4144403.1 3-oxoacyl-ACP reductase FabG [Candidatus Thermoplasmatota archaeon]MBU4591560.1 3-oxoacyl-ACP reductase FabG [Candidatus Thermoplasmatota archaeon]
MNAEFDGRTAVITGASRGIGRGIALELAQHGANVVVVYRAEEKLAKQVAAAVRTMGRKAMAVKCDVSIPEDVTELHDTVLAELGNADFIINNAGIHQHLKSWELSDEDWHRVMDVNITGTFLVSRAFIPHMMERKSGRIINISSCVAFTGTDHEVHYAASKGAVLGLTKSLALELAPYRINVNAIAPGYIETDMVVFEGVHDRESVIKGIPAHRLGQPEDIGRAARFLCSRDSEYITGQVIHVNGGLIMY